MIRNLGANLIISPPLVFTEEHVDEMTGMLTRAFDSAEAIRNKTTAP